MKLITMAALAAGALLIGAPVYAGDSSGGGGGSEPVLANVTGTGKVIANGKAAWVDFVVTCPKGTRWSVDESAGFNFVSVDGDQAPGRLEVSSGECLGKQQAVKIKFVPFFATVGPGCGDYSMTFFFSGGQEIGLNWSPGVDEVTGPPVCLTSNASLPNPKPSPTPTAVPVP